MSDTEDAFRRHWKGSSKVLFKDEDGSVDVEGMFDFGGFFYEGKWSAVSFEIAPREDFRPGSFGMIVNSTVVQLGKGIDVADRYIPVVIYYDAKAKKASLTLRGEVFDEWSVIQDDWDKNLKLTFWHNNWTGKLSIRRVVVTTQP